MDTDRIVVRGWAADADDYNRAVDVHIVINGTTIGHAYADQYRPDVQTAFGIGEYHGYQFECGLQGMTGTLTVEAHGIDVETGLNYLIGSKTVTIPSRCWCSGSFGGTYVTTADVALRSGHGPLFNQLATIPKGTTLTLTKAAGFGADNYGHVTYNGISGFVSMEHVHVDLGEDFYAYIILSEPWKHLTNDEPNVSMRTGTGARNQVWRFQGKSDGSYKITSALDGTCMDVQNASAAAGANVQTAADNSTNAQRWNIAGSSGQYLFSAKSGTTVMEVYNNDHTDGTNVQMNTLTGDPNQRFSVWVVEDYGPPVPKLPEISLSASAYDMTEGNYSVHDSITVSWSAKYADSYWLDIENNQDGSYLVKKKTTDTSYTFTPPGVGSYTIALWAYNFAGETERVDKTVYVRDVVGDTWVSDSLMGEEKFSFPRGTEVFFNYELFDSHTHDLLYTFSTMDTYVTLSIIDPSGDVVATRTFNNDDSDYLSCVCTEPGEYTAQVDLWGGIFHSHFTIEPCQHAYTGTVTEPTCTEQGYTTYTCSACGDSYVGDYVDALGHDYVDGICSRCGEEDPSAIVLFKLVGASMTLGNELAMNFFVKTADLEGTDYYAQIVKTYADGREDQVVTIPYADWITNGSNKRFSFNGMAAKEMADEIYVTIYRNDGTQVSEAWEDSVAAYVGRNLAKWNDKNRTMGVDMLNYGAAAQNYFNYNEADLANAGVDAYQQYATADVACTDSRVKGTNYVGSALALESSIMLTMYFNNISTDMYAVVTFTDHYGNAKSVTIPGSEFKQNGSRYGVVISALAVADARQQVSCKVYKADGTEVANAVDSVESYVARMSSLDPLFQKIMNFSVGAYNSFH